MTEKVLFSLLTIICLFALKITNKVMDGHEQTSRVDRLRGRLKKDLIGLLVIMTTADNGAYNSECRPATYS